MFENRGAVRQILEHIDSLDFTKVVGGSSIQLYDTTKRHFGSMLSAHDLLSGPYAHLIKRKPLRESLYQQVVELGNVLSCGFSTASGVPRNWVDPVFCTTDDANSNTIAGAGSLILEFARLSGITGHRVYVEHAKRAQQYLLDPKPEKYVSRPGLLGSNIRISTGELNGRKGSWGSLSDSFYEYLLKMYIYDSDTYAPYLERWKLAADSTIRYIASHPFGHPEWTLLPYWKGDNVYNAMDSLSWFASGNFILGGMVTDNQTLVDFGISIADTAGALYQATATGLGGEALVWVDECSPDFLANFHLEECNASNSVQWTDTEYKLRPEVIESWYHAYRATKDPKYREWAWSVFKAIDSVCKTESGYSAISDVNAVDGGKKLDEMESFVFAEVMKYIWLIHLEDDKAPFHVMDSRTGSSNRWVYNTEAHPFKVAEEHV
ncbi:hypothetical protein LTR56_014150 [Elasticomyces elasticus]|nr:hypothetical protein LTR56_014150 [Elasticomyces elasticus]KAK3662758.1 hypothetical protein LTR22_006374 [Elasticomyces elasticus]KAK4918018.1 hypothetical protein LTR49_014156 [Elasticomyces elasticus]KAK5754484.1 hypothetical protein LTS12_015439 [Elasticomyces elasticus]